MTSFTLRMYDTHAIICAGPKSELVRRVGDELHAFERSREIYIQKLDIIYVDIKMLNCSSLRSPA